MYLLFKVEIKLQRMILYHLTNTYLPTTRFLFKSIRFYWPVFIFFVEGIIYTVYVIKWGCTQMHSWNIRSWGSTTVPHWIDSIIGWYFNWITLLDNKNYITYLWITLFRYLFLDKPPAPRKIRMMASFSIINLKYFNEELCLPALDPRDTKTVVEVWYNWGCS